MYNLAREQEAGEEHPGAYKEGDQHGTNLFIGSQGGRHHAKECEVH